MNWEVFWTAAAVILSALIAVVTVTATVVYVQANVENLKATGAAQAQKEAQAGQQVVDMLVLLKSFIAEQSQVNKTVANVLDGLVVRVDRMEHSENDLGKVIELLTAVLERKQILTTDKS